MPRVDSRGAPRAVEYTGRDSLGSFPGDGCERRQFCAEFSAESVWFYDRSERGATSMGGARP